MDSSQKYSEFTGSPSRHEESAHQSVKVGRGQRINLESRQRSDSSATQTSLRTRMGSSRLAVINDLYEPSNAGKITEIPVASQMSEAQFCTVMIALYADWEVESPKLKQETLESLLMYFVFNGCSPAHNWEKVQIPDASGKTYPLTTFPNHLGHTDEDTIRQFAAARAWMIEAMFLGPPLPKEQDPYQISGKYKDLIPDLKAKKGGQQSAEAAVGAIDFMANSTKVSTDVAHYARLAKANNLMHSSGFHYRFVPKSSGRFAGDADAHEMQRTIESAPADGAYNRF